MKKMKMILAALLALMMLLAAGCGVALLATAHAGNLEELTRRPLWRRVLREGIFRNAVLIRMRDGVRSYCLERLEDVPCCG